jgi:predicted signal transduction protein with EAL and GGDEF domain
VLGETAQRVSALLRAGDLVCRQGGDEFLLLLSCDHGLDAATIALETGERIAAALERPFSVLGAEFHIGASIGAAVFPTHADDAESLFKRADTAMYQSKRLGGGNVALYEPEANDSRQRLSLTTQLRKAIAEDELLLHYQPIFDVVTGQLHSLEALVRWQHPERGLVPPGMFIPVAEQTGLIDAIGDWVVADLCRQAAEWAARGHRPGLTFNVSPRQLRRPDLAQSIVSEISGRGLDPGQFCVELTETSVLSDEKRQRSLLDELHDAGLVIAVDDFGAGHSSLARLRDLPVGLLKVDRSFLAAVPGDERAKAIVAAMLELGRALGMMTVVEGVEDTSQLDFLRLHGCPLAQGFLLCRPIPAEAVFADTPAVAA